jgi:hypothetical protein
MSKRVLILSLCAAVLVGGLVIAGFAYAAGETLAGPSGLPASPALTQHGATSATEQLFRGDLTAELGLGCSNPTGTSGGPNDWAVGVVATLTPPYGFTSTTYNLFTQISPNINSFNFFAWVGGPVPGAPIGSQAGLPFAQGNHTAAIAPPINVTAAQAPGGVLYFGFNQPQANVGMRIGLDSSSGSAATSFIRAPTCGAGAFTLIDGLGFPGNWVMAAIINDFIPVELMNFKVE